MLLNYEYEKVRSINFSKRAFAEASFPVWPFENMALFITKALSELLATMCFLDSRLKKRMATLAFVMHDRFKLLDFPLVSQRPLNFDSALEKVASLRRSWRARQWVLFLFETEVIR